MNTEHGLLGAYILNGEGGARKLTLDEVPGWSSDQGPLWLHWQCDEEAVQWLNEESGLHPMMAEALISPDTRPRCMASRHGLLLLLRGINLSPQADPEDMVSLRIWTDGKRLISVRRRVVYCVRELRAELEDGDGPDSIPEILVQIAERLTDRMGPFIEGLDTHLDRFEEEHATADTNRETPLRRTVAEVRRQTVAIRRYIAPQRDALLRLAGEPQAGLSENKKLRILETQDQVTRQIEDLDLCRERAIVIHEELSAHLAEELNRRMYLLGIVTTVFLPLGLITGLLGINVGGMPGTESPSAFWIVSALLVIVTVGEVIALRLWRML